MKRIVFIFFLLISTNVYAMEGNNSYLLKEVSKNTLRDLKYILKKPLHMDKKDWLYFSSFITATGVLLANDKSLLNSIKSDKGAEQILKSVKPVGDARYTLPFFTSTYLFGELDKNENLMNFSSNVIESLALTGILTVGIQEIGGRERPDKGGKFKWFRYGHFPSGHSAISFAIAPIIDKYYLQINESDSSSIKTLKYIGKLFCYGIPSMVALERLRNYDHYPSDVFLGAALGLFCGNLINYLNNKNNSWRFKTGFNSEGVVFKVTKNF
jgi:hypothetical protein